MQLLQLISITFNLPASHLQPACLFTAQAVIAEGERRGDAAVGTSEVVHKPSDAEVALRCLAARLRGLRGLGAAQGVLLVLVLRPGVAKL